MDRRILDGEVREIIGKDEKGRWITRFISRAEEPKQGIILQRRSLSDQLASQMDENRKLREKYERFVSAIPLERMSKSSLLEICKILNLPIDAEPSKEELTAKIKGE